jgi:hypothetical protein
MNFFEKDKGVKFTFELEDGQSLQLIYLLQANSLREKWTNEVKTYMNESDTYLNLKISNKNYSHLNQLTAKLNSIIKDINSEYKYKILVPLDGTGDVSREKLNDLHEKFEEYGEHSSPYNGKLYNGEKVHNFWLDLNEWIHITETAMETGEDDFPNYGGLVTIYPPYPGRKLEERDKLFLTTEFLWGHLYLGYNTLGKDYMHVSQDDDVRVITNDQVKVQERYSSEVWLCFQQKTYFLKDIESEFYKWYETTGQDAQEKIPLENLNKLALGRYYLGHILINEDLLRFHPIEEDWYFNPHVQKRWNNEVFSQIKNVISIELLNE